MSKSSFNKNYDTIVERERLRELYRNNIFNIFMSSHVWKGLNYRQQNFVMRKFWAEGSIALFRIKHMEGTDEEFAFAPFTPQYYDLYDYPTDVKLTRFRNAKFVPLRTQAVDKDVVICYIQPSKKSVVAFADTYIDKIVNVEMVLQIALNAQKMPFIFDGAPEVKREMESLYNALMSDNPKIFVNGGGDSIKALLTGAPFIVDKLYNYKSTLWNELLTFLGVNNLGVNEKKEHLVTSEVEANDDYVEASGSCFTDNLKDFCKRAKDVLGINIDVMSRAELNTPKEPDDPDESEDEEGEEEND